MAALDVSITGGEALDRVIAELDRTRDSLPGEMVGAVEQETNRLVELAQALVRSMPTHGDRHTGLRNTVADGVGVTQVISGDEILIEVTTSMPQSNMESIPAGLDAGQWSHPLFANRNYWYTQHGAYSWFSDTFKAGQRDYTKSLTDVLTAARDRIAAAAS